VIAMLLAGLLVAVPGASDSALAIQAPDTPSARVPGTRLRLGQSLGATDSGGVFHRAPASAGSPTRAGACRFFGLEAVGSLWFDGGRLARALFEVDSLSPHSAEYVQDQLRRLGYHPRWDVLEPGRSQCEWSGAARVVVSLDGARLSAEVTPAPHEPTAEETPVVTPPAAAAEPIPDTLAIGRVTGPYPAPESATWDSIGPTPTYPDAARRAGVQGVVRVLALVDTSGAVIEASVARSIPELDAAALDAVRGSRFRPYVYEGRPRRFRVIVPVLFALH
jgi:TonB family protein